MKLGPLDECIMESDLKDPESCLVKGILYIYTLETFVYETLNYACKH